MIEETEVNLPKATVFKLIKEMLPNDLRCANETRELIVDCLTGVFLFESIFLTTKVEYIHLLASEANEICIQEKKRTIGPEHILKALNKLGFSEYIAEVENVYSDHKQEALDFRKCKESSKHKLSDDELVKRQQELFAAARTSFAQVDDIKLFNRDYSINTEEQEVQKIKPINSKYVEEDDYDQE